MALTLSADLLAAQRANRRRPAVAVTASAERFASPVFTFREIEEPGGTAAPVAAAVNSTGVRFLLSNRAGTLEYSVDDGYTWTTIDTVTAGQGFAVAAWAAPYFVAVWGDGNDLKYDFYHPTNGWLLGPSVAVTEASPIGSVAVATGAAAALCAFYTLGTGTTLKRLRRSSAGTWDGSGTNWSRSGSVASITGLAAVYKADYLLAITGTEVTTTDPKVWAAAMGDTSLPANAWSGLLTVAEADSGSSVTFTYPSLALFDGHSEMLFTVHDTATSTDQCMLTHTTASAEHLSPWTEPFPPPAAVGTDTPYGAAIATDTSTTPDDIYLFTRDKVQKHTGVADLDLSPYVESVRWRETPESLQLQLQLSDTLTFNAETEEYEGFATDPAVALGHDLLIQHGFTTGYDDGDPENEYGAVLRVNISRITRAFGAGKQRLIIDADGPWEALARYRAPQAWTAPASSTRGTIFQHIAARAGVEVAAASGDFAPSDDWDTVLDFAVAPGETGRAVLDRLLAPTGDALRAAAADGGFEICGLGDNNVAETFTLPRPVANPYNEHALESFELVEQHVPNWTRTYGPSAYEDAYWFNGIHTAARPARFPIFQLLRNTADETGLAVASLKRAQLYAAFGEIVAPAHVGIELYDHVTVNYNSEMAYAPRRAIGRGIDFKRGPAAAAAATFNTVLTLGAEIND